MSKNRETREMEMREEFDMGFVSPFCIDKIREDGKSYKWVSTSEASWSLSEAERQGWVPVPASKSPFKAVDSLKRNRYPEFVTYKDTILMERPERYCVAERARDSKIRQDRIRTLRGVANDYNNISLVRNVR